MLCICEVLDLCGSIGAGQIKRIETNHTSSVRKSGASEIAGRENARHKNAEHETETSVAAQNQCDSSPRPDKAHLARVDCRQCDFRFELFFSFSFVLVLQYFFVLVLVLPVIF